MDRQTAVYFGKAERKLGGSRRLLEMGDFEESVSSAYFAMAFCARGALATEGSYPKTHRGISSEFSRVFVKPKALPLRPLKDLEVVRSYREEADYSPESETSEAEAREALEKSAKFLREARAHVGGPTGQ